MLCEKKITRAIMDQEIKQEKTGVIDLNNNDYMHRISNFVKSSNSIKATVLCNKGKTAFIGGFYDGKLKIINCQSNSQTPSFENITPFIEESPILAVEVNKEEGYLFVGNGKGNIATYKIDIANNKYEPIIQLYDQMSPICNINCNDQLNMWISSSIDGYINLYTLPLCK